MLDPHYILYGTISRIAESLGTNSNQTTDPSTTTGKHHPSQWSHARHLSIAETWNQIGASWRFALSQIGSFALSPVGALSRRETKSGACFEHDRVPLGSTGIPHWLASNRAACGLVWAPNFVAIESNWKFRARHFLTSGWVSLKGQLGVNVCSTGLQIYSRPRKGPKLDHDTRCNKMR